MKFATVHIADALRSVDQQVLLVLPSDYKDALVEADIYQ